MSDDESPFKVGDRVRTSNDPALLKEGFRGMLGTITDIYDSSSTMCRVRFDDKPSPEDKDGWNIKRTSMSLADPTDDEILQLFSLQQPPLDGDSTRIELLEHIDRALRDGKKLPRANLAFEFLLKSLELSRLDLPSYVHDMQQES